MKMSKHRPSNKCRSYARQRVDSVADGGTESQLRPPSGDGSYESECDSYCLADAEPQSDDLVPHDHERRVKTRVVKLGGSLLELPDLDARTHRWLAEHPARVNLFVVGGGAIVQSVRNLDQIHALDSNFAHWTCIDLMNATARIAAQLFTDFQQLVTPNQLAYFLKTGSAKPRDAIVHVRAFYHPGRTDLQLPESWDTTSDSLAALLATDVHADELVLLKSVTPSNQFDGPVGWSQAGLVDSAFPALVAQIPTVKIVNLRRS